MNTLQTLIDALRARRGLRADGGRDRPRLRRPPARQLRLRPADHGRRLHARRSPTAGTRALSILCCFAVVIALTLLMDVRRLPAAARRVARDDARRHLRGQLLLQNIALLKFTVAGQDRSAPSTGLNRPIGDGSRCSSAGSGSSRRSRPRSRSRRARRCSSNRTNLGLHMRAAAADFRTARLLGVRANRTIFVAVLLSGVLAAVVAVLLIVARRRT